MANTGYIMHGVSGLFYFHTYYMGGKQKYLVEKQEAQ